MPDSAIQIFADLTRRQLVLSPTAVVEKRIDSPAPPFHQDKLYLSIQPMLINPGGGDSAPYTLVPAEDFSITALLVTTAGVTLSGPVTSWTTDGTAANGVIDLHTSAMATAFANAATLYIQSVFYFQFVGASGKTTIRQEMRIDRSYITTGTPSELPLETYPTWAEAKAFFIRKGRNDPGDSITLVDENDVFERCLRTNTDGSFGTDPS